MHEAPAFFFKLLELSVDARLVPSQSRPNSARRLTAAGLRPARAQSDRHATKKNVSQRDGALVSYGFDGFGNDMAAVSAQRLAQTRIERRGVGDGQGLAPVPLSDRVSTILGHAGLRAYKARPLADRMIQVFLLHRCAKSIGGFGDMGTQLAGNIAGGARRSGQLAANQRYQAGRAIVAVIVQDMPARNRRIVLPRGVREWPNAGKTVAN